MMSRNPYSRLVLLLTILSMVHSFSSDLLVLAYSNEWDYLLYPKSNKLQRFDTEFNFQKHIVAIQYTADPITKIQEYYSNRMLDWGWEKSAFPSPYSDLGFGEKGSFLYFEQKTLACSIIVLSDIVDNSNGSLISIEVTDKPAGLREHADIAEIAREIAPIPLFPGAADPIIFKTNLGELQTSVNYETNFSVRHVADFYRRQLGRQGYKEEMCFENYAGADVYQNTYYIKHDSKVIVGISQDDRGKTSVLLLITGEGHSAQLNRQAVRTRGISA